MMPNTSVSPAASRNNSRPNCNPFRNCSTMTSMDPYRDETKQRQRERAAAYFIGCMSLTKPLTLVAGHAPAGPPTLLHRALVVEAVLIVLDDGGHSFQRELALGILDHVLEVEILDRDVVVAIFERAAHRLEVDLFHRGLHLVLLGRVALDRHHGAVDQLCCVIGLCAVEGRAQAGMLLAVVGDEALVLFVRQVV